MSTPKLFPALALCACALAAWYGAHWQLAAVLLAMLGAAEFGAWLHLRAWVRAARAELDGEGVGQDRRALRDDTWAEAVDDADRPTEVVIGGTTYAVRPLTAPTLKRFTELGEPVFALQAAMGPMASLLGGRGLTSEQVSACYDAMYAQLACLLHDPASDEEPTPERLGLYVPITRLTELIQLLGPGGG